MLSGAPFPPYCRVSCLETHCLHGHRNLSWASMLFITSTARSHSEIRAVPNNSRFKWPSNSPFSYTSDLCPTISGFRCLVFLKSNSSNSDRPPPSCCVAAHQAMLRSVKTSGKPLSLNRPSEPPLILFNALPLLIKRGALRRFVQNRSYDIIPITETWVKESILMNQIILKSCI